MKNSESIQSIEKQNYCLTADELDNEKFAFIQEMQNRLRELSPETFESALIHGVVDAIENMADAYSNQSYNSI